MDELEFLQEEFENVERVLKETLRHDYGPQGSAEYYGECANRLQIIKRNISGISSGDLPIIAAQMNELGVLASFISLVERSHLGEFSWPFAEAIRSIAEVLLSERSLGGDFVKPIIHVVSDGRGYRIYNERLPRLSSRRRLAIVFFPRSLKHHVLLHTIFGHELGHSAVFASTAGRIINSDVIIPLSSQGPLKSASECERWLRSPNAPPEIKSSIAKYETDKGKRFLFSEQSRNSWLIELFCDLFGLMIFGPAFVAAHRTILPPLRPSAFSFRADESTHPPYPIRQKMLARALRLLNWDSPAALAGDADDVRQAEKLLLDYVCHDPFSNWAEVFSEDQIRAAIEGLRRVVSTNPAFGYEPPNGGHVVALVRRMANELPPLVEAMESDGTPRPSRIPAGHILYAGWVYWIGRAALRNASSRLNFLSTNQLCDLALLQQNAINIFSS